MSSHLRAIHRPESPDLRSTALIVALAIGALLPARALAQVVVPFTTTLPFTNTSEVSTHVVDLGSLPLRPELVITAVPDANHGNLEIQIELTNFSLAGTPGQQFCPDPGASLFSPPGPGIAQLVWKAWGCQPNTGTLVGDTATVRVRVTSFGSAGAPANVHLSLRGVTTAPTSTQHVPYFPPGQPQVVTLPAAADTTIYERDPAGSNGAGQFVWAGRDVGTTAPFTPFAVRGLLSFDLRNSPIPDTATIDSAELRLDVESILGTGNSLSIWSIGFEGSWDEGDADASGNEFQAASSTTRAANWLHRGVPGNSNFLWSTPGASPEESLATQSITTTGVKSFTGTALRNAVTSMLGDFLNTSGHQDAFVLRGAESSAASSGVQIASRTNQSVGAERPQLRVTLTQAPGDQEDLAQIGVVTFINEGQNLRWIYDLDQDDVFETPVGGVCTITSPGGNFMPYSYRFDGTPGYTGHDCCTWHIDSPTTGTVGTGQLIFYHNLDASLAANIPPDSDRDGIRDLCDNCPNQANGPLQGTCRGGSNSGRPCRSNAECPASSCDLSQQDVDGDRTGDACVPEPAMAGALAAGLLALACLAQRSKPSRRAAALSAASATRRSGSLASQIR